MVQYLHRREDVRAESATFGASPQGAKRSHQECGNNRGIPVTIWLKQHVESNLPRPPGFVPAGRSLASYGASLFFAK